MSSDRSKIETLPLHNFLAFYALKFFVKTIVPQLLSETIIIEWRRDRNYIM